MQSQSQRTSAPKATAAPPQVPPTPTPFTGTASGTGTGTIAAPKSALRALLKDHDRQSSSPLANRTLASSSPAPPPQTYAGPPPSKSIASLLGKRKDPPASSSSSSSADLQHPIPMPPTSATAVANANAKRVTRKNVTITPSHAAPGQPLNPELRQFKYPTWSSNTDQLRNSDSLFLSHPAQEMLKYRMVVDSPPCTPWQFTREMQRKHQMQQALWVQQQQKLQQQQQAQLDPQLLNGQPPQQQHQQQQQQQGPPRDGPITVIVHPGSRYIRAGFETDVVPRVIMPNCLARRRIAPNEPVRDPRGTWRAEDADLVDLPASAKLGYDDSLGYMENFMNAHIKEDNIRVPYNARGLITSYNGQSRPTQIPAVNDPFHIEWTSIPNPTASSPATLFGQQALDMDLPTRQHYTLRYPLVAKSINTRDYPSWSLWHADMSSLLDHVLSSPELQIQSYADRARTRMVLVIPDLLDLRAVDELMRIALDTLQIGAVLVALESPMSCLGAGLMTATVVDIGAQATSIAVVENGDVVDAARVLAGGDDVSDVLFDMMRRYKNPITRDVPEDASGLDDYARGVPVNRRALVEQIKEGFCTGIVRDAAVIKVSEVYVREPGRVTEKFTVKMYDELYMAPLCLFYPWCIDLPAKLLALKRYSPLLVERTHPSRQMPLWTMDPLNKLGPHPWISWGCTDVPAHLEAHTGLEHRVAVTAQLMWLDELDRNKRHTKRRANGEVSEVGAFDEDKSEAGKKAKKGKRQANKPVATALGFPGFSPPTGRAAADGDGNGDVEMRDAAETEDEEEASETDQQGMQLRRSRRANTPADAVPPPAPSPAAPAAPQLANLPPHCSTLYTYTHTWASPPLDQAIHALIANQRTDDRIRRNYSSILLVGGGARLPGFATKVLEPMLRTSMPARARTLAPAPGTAPETAVAVTLPPRDLDPRAVMWKGGTVLARLEVASEMWVSLGEWRAVGTASVVANKCGVVVPGSGVVGNLSGPAASLTMDPVYS